MARRRRSGQVRFIIPAPFGEGYWAEVDPDDWSAFDTDFVERWLDWRASYPVRGTGGVLRTGFARPPSPEQQSAWSLYTARDPVGRIIQEWWMPPFLVPIADVAPVPGVFCEQALMQCSVDPASGGPETHQHYTNIHRIASLANCHPRVVALGRQWPTVTFNSVGRAMEEFRQSPFDLRINVGGCTKIIVGCSVAGAREDLLSLWWAPCGGRDLSSESESLAQAVFFDVVEAAHQVPLGYARDFNFVLGLPLPAAQPVAARDIRVEPGRFPAWCSGSATGVPFLGAATSVDSTAAPLTASAAPSTSSAAPATSTAAPSSTSAWLTCCLRRCRNSVGAMLWGHARERLPAAPGAG